MICQTIRASSSAQQRLRECEVLSSQSILHIITTRAQGKFHPLAALYFYSMP